MKTIHKIAMSVGLMCAAAVLFLGQPAEATAVRLGEECIRGEYVENDKCQGATTRMCKGPPACFPQD